MSFSQKCSQRKYSQTGTNNVCNIYRRLSGVLVLPRPPWQTLTVKCFIQILISYLKNLFTVPHIPLLLAHPSLDVIIKHAETNSSCCFLICSRYISGFMFRLYVLLLVLSYSNRMLCIPPHQDRQTTGRLSVYLRSQMIKISVIITK